ncbi:TPA: hypothetical protein L6B67_23520 [Pseudomonas aeruginosa]|nr:hypothetical protein [Pseudomonas aeruginosa]
MQADRRDAPAHPARRGRQPERPASGAATRRAAPTGELEQTLPLRNRACGAFQEGSLERRDCRAHIGLQFRD